MRLLIINYHYFREKKPPSGIYPLTLKEFTDQIDELAKLYQFISQEQLVDWVRKDSYPEKNFCLLTFDDGLKEQVDIFELLVRKGIGGIFFVITNPIRYNIVVDVHKLHYIRSVMQDERLFEFLTK